MSLRVRVDFTMTTKSEPMAIDLTQADPDPFGREAGQGKALKSNAVAHNGVSPTTGRGANAVRSKYSENPPRCGDMLKTDALSARQDIILLNLVNSVGLFEATNVGEAREKMIILCKQWGVEKLTKNVPSYPTEGVGLRKRILQLLDRHPQSEGRDMIPEELHRDKLVSQLRMKGCLAFLRLVKNSALVKCRESPDPGQIPHTGGNTSNQNSSERLRKRKYDTNSGAIDEGGHCVGQHSSLPKQHETPSKKQKTSKKHGLLLSSSSESSRNSNGIMKGTDTSARVPANTNALSVRDPANRAEQMAPESSGSVMRLRKQNSEKRNSRQKRSTLLPVGLVGNNENLDTSVRKIGMACDDQSQGRQIGSTLDGKACTNLQGTKYLSPKAVEPRSQSQVQSFEAPFQSEGDLDRSESNVIQLSIERQRLELHKKQLEVQMEEARLRHELELQRLSMEERDRVESRRQKDQFISLLSDVVRTLKECGKTFCNENEADLGQGNH